MAKRLVIIGAGGHARAVISSALAAGLIVEKVLDNTSIKGENICGISVISPINSILDTYIECNEIEFFVAYGKNKLREQMHIKLKAKNANIANIIDPSATVRSIIDAKKGIYIGPGAVVSVDVSLGEGVILNTMSSVDHESIVGDFSQIGPHAGIAGRTSIGESCLVGMGANIVDKLEIGNHVTIGAGALLLKNAESESVWMGVPAKKK